MVTVLTDTDQRLLAISVHSLCEKFPCNEIKHATNRNSGLRSSIVKDARRETLAANKARSFEENGNSKEAQTWRHIEAALKLMRGPNQS
jgi:hypothetical protein